MQDFFQQSKRIGRVYNIQVEGEPEYFANFVLVHNCVISLALAYQKCAVIYADVEVSLIDAQSKQLNTSSESATLLQGTERQSDDVITVI